MKIYTALAVLLMLLFGQPMLGMEEELNSQLRQAITRDYLGKAKMLIEEGANPTIKDKEGNTALHMAAQRGDAGFCKLLLDYGVDVNAKDNKGKTPLRYATWGDNRAMCRLLLEHGADVNAQNNNGTTALAHACNYSRGSIALRTLLLDHGADIRIKNKYGYTPMSYSNRTIEEAIILITHSRFYPYYTAKKLSNAQHLTRARLWVMKQVCPQLPRDLKEMILASDEMVWRDACATPLRFHTKKYNRVRFLALPALRTLIKHNALEKDKTVSLLLDYKYAEILTLLKECAKANPQKQQFFSELLELDLSAESEKIIRADLEPENTGWFSGCFLQ